MTEQKNNSQNTEESRIEEIIRKLEAGTLTAEELNNKDILLILAKFYRDCQTITKTVVSHGTELQEAKRALGDPQEHVQVLREGIRRLLPKIAEAESRDYLNKTAKETVARYLNTEDFNKQLDGHMTELAQSKDGAFSKFLRKFTIKSAAVGFGVVIIGAVVMGYIGHEVIKILYKKTEADRIDALEQRIDNIDKNKISHFEKEVIPNYNERITRIEGALDSQRLSFDSLNQSVGEVKGKLPELKDEFKKSSEELGKKLDETNRSLAEKIESNYKDIDAKVDAKLGKFTTQYTQLSGELRTLKDTFDTYKEKEQGKKNLYYEAQLKKLGDNISELKKTLEETYVPKDDFNSQNAKNKSEKEDVEARLKALEVLNAKVNDLAKGYELLKSKYDASKKE